MPDLWQNFKNQNPILAPALEATYHFSRTQLLMNLVLTVLAIPASWYFGLVPDLQLWPTIKAVAIVYGALLLAWSITSFARLLRLRPDSDRRLMIRRREYRGGQGSSEMRWSRSAFTTRLRLKLKPSIDLRTRSFSLSAFD